MAVGPGGKDLAGAQLSWPLAGASLRLHGWSHGLSWLLQTSVVSVSQALSSQALWQLSVANSVTATCHICLSQALWQLAVTSVCHRLRRSCLSHALPQALSQLFVTSVCLRLCRSCLSHLSVTGSAGGAGCGGQRQIKSNI